MALKSWKNLEKALERMFDPQDRIGAKTQKSEWNVSADDSVMNRTYFREVMDILQDDHQQGISDISVTSQRAAKGNGMQYRISSRNDWNPIRQELGHWPLERIEVLIDLLWDARCPALAIETMWILHMLRQRREHEEFGNGANFIEPKSPFVYDECNYTKSGYTWDLTAITNLMGEEASVMRECLSMTHRLPLCIIRKGGRWYVEACEYDKDASEYSDYRNNVKRHLLIPVERFSDYHNENMLDPMESHDSIIECNDIEEEVVIEATTTTNLLGCRLEEGMRLKFTTVVDEFLARKLLAHGSKIRVIQPESLKKQMMSIIFKR